MLLEHQQIHTRHYINVIGLGNAVAIDVGHEKDIHRDNVKE
jgi:hypothetical protein